MRLIRIVSPLPCFFKDGFRGSFPLKRDGILVLCPLLGRYIPSYSRRFGCIIRAPVGCCNHMQSRDDCQTLHRITERTGLPLIDKTGEVSRHCVPYGDQATRHDSSTTFTSTSSTLHMYHIKTLRYGANFSECLSMSCSDMYFHCKTFTQ